MGGKFKLLGLPCWGSLHLWMQNWNCKDWSRWSHSACAAPGAALVVRPLTFVATLHLLYTVVDSVVFVNSLDRVGKS